MSYCEYASFFEIVPSESVLDIKFFPECIRDTSLLHSPGTDYLRGMNIGPLRRKLELIWWGFTLVAVSLVLLPIRLQTPDYPFYLPNALYIVIFITFARYTFFLKHTFIARMLWPKLLILAGSIILVFILIMSLGDFSNFLSEEGLQTVVGNLTVPRQYALMRYIQSEMIFFGVASVMSAIALPVRMLISIFRMHNQGTI